MTDITDLSDWKTEKLDEALGVVLEADEETLIEVLTMKGASLWPSSELVNLLNTIAGEIQSRVEKACQIAGVVN